MSIEWNLIRLGHPAHGIVTKTVQKTLQGGGGGLGVVGGQRGGVGGNMVPLGSSHDPLLNAVTGYGRFVFSCDQFVKTFCHLFQEGSSFSVKYCFEKDS